MNEFNAELVILSLRNFLFHREEKTISAMASDFGHPEWLGYLYCDGFEQGIAINSHVTGKVQHFQLSKVLKDEEGDIEGWEFRAVNDIPKVKKAIVFND